MNVPIMFWSNVVLNTSYKINRSPTSIVKGGTPRSVLFLREPPFMLPPRIFGCICFVHQLAPGGDKLDLRIIPCVFLGYLRTVVGVLVQYNRS